MRRPIRAGRLPGRLASAIAVASCLAVGTVPAATAAAAPPPSAGGSRTQWPQYQGDAGHTGWDRGETLLTPDNVGDLAPAWSAFSESFVPTVAGGVVFHIGNIPDRLEALDAADGHLLWRSGPNLSGHPSVLGSTVYVTRFNGLLALDAASGAELWFTPTEQELNGPPVIADGLVYEVSSGIATLYAIDASTGDIVWSRPIPAGSVPAAAGHRVFIQTISRLLALEPATGRVLWRARVASGFGFAPVATPWGVVVVSRHGAVHVFDPATGVRMWRSRSAGYTSLAANWTHVLAVSRQDGRITSFDALTGAKRWSTVVSGERFGMPPVIGGGVLFDVADDGTIVALRTSDGMRLPVDLPDATQSAGLALFRGTLFVQSPSILSVYALLPP
jgi:outer membrane protein assembly factor BamB